MLFNSFDFAFFLPIVFILYWFMTKSNRKAQNILLLIASYVFYGWWDWRFLGLVVLSSFVDFFIGKLLHNEERNSYRKIYLFLSIFVNIGLLFFFKYFNFFIDSFSNAFSFFGHTLNATRLNIILPVGISFYTFQTLSYTIDIYKKKLKPTSDIISFFAFVSFFPQLVAGPIERATNLLPQFQNEREFNFNKAADGMRQILWGLFKKIVIADNCAIILNPIFENHTEHSGSTLLLGAILFAFQIYGDFSGYSDIAIGTSRLLGFSLMQNFAFPYFSRNIGEFWRRWHISLSTWFRDYLYIPLGGSKVGLVSKIRNVFVIFIVSGFWHGANWTFIVWGLLHTIYFMPLMLLNKNRKHLQSINTNRIYPSIKEFISILTTFSLVVVAWVFFRSDNLTMAFQYLSKIFSVSLFVMPSVFPLRLFIFIGLLLGVEWINRDKNHGLEINSAYLSPLFKRLIYLTLLLVIILFGSESETFIYFQF